MNEVPTEPMQTQPDMETVVQTTVPQDEMTSPTNEVNASQPTMTSTPEGSSKVEPVPVRNVGPKVLAPQLPQLTPEEMAEEISLEKTPPKKNFWRKLFGTGD